MRPGFTSPHSCVLQLHEVWLSSPAESVQMQKSQRTLFFHHSTSTILLTTYRTLTLMPSAYFNKVLEGKQQAVTKVVVKAFVAQMHE